MIKRHVLILGISLLLMFTIPFTGLADRWVLHSLDNTLPLDLDEKILQAGGTVIQTLDDVAIVVVDFTRQEDAKIMESEGMEVLPDLLMIQPLDGGIPEEEHAGFLFDDLSAYQWHLPVIEADRAHGEGLSGAGVRIAVLDTGIWYYHPDLNPNIDFSAGASFVPGVTDFLDDNGHGTHVAGVIAAVADGRGVTGVAPNAVLIPIKVLDQSGTGNISWLINGIIHAVEQRADIINLCMGTYIYKDGYLPYYTAQEAALLRKMLRNVIKWAQFRGVLVVHSAGNAGLDLDQSRDLVSIPTEIGNGLVVSATGPTGLTNFDAPASYTNYGMSAISVAAPGGEHRNYPEDGWWLDMVFSTTIDDGWMWASGTSLSASMVSGVAALVIEKYGRIPPNQLKNHLTATSDDLGAPGKDPYYGHGRINAYKAVTQ